MTQICPEDLRRLYRDGRVIPFLGAGVSMAVKWNNGEQETRGPSWQELVDEACSIMGVQEPQLMRMRGSDLQILEYFHDKQGVLPP